MRKLTGLVGWGAGAYAVSASLFHLWTAGYGTYEPRLQRSLHLLFLVPLIFLAFPFNSRSPKDRPSGFDWLWAALSAVASLYLIWDRDWLNHRWEGASPIRPDDAAPETALVLLIGSVMIVLVIEACRRSLSPWMALTISVSLLYLATSQWVPGVFNFKGYSFRRMVEFMYLAGDEGIYGFLTGISANILFIYVLFAAVMLKAGVGEFVIDVAVRLAGWARGGPAKIAVIGSALFGTISGSTVANVYATGSFTIPLMKKGGYSPKNAAAIEAIAGTGGQIMPPVMGAGVFIMSEITGISYFDIIKAAAIPAILYYIGLFAMVHFLALRYGMQPVPKRELPSWRPVLRRAYFAIPFVLIVYLLAQGYSPTGAAFYTILVTFGLSFLDRKTWMTPRKCWGALSEAAFSAGTIAVALAGSGMIVGVLTRTGAALAFSGVVVQAAQGVLIVAMILIFVVVSVLGTGIPTTAAYVISVTVGAAAMGNLGVSVLAAHLFVFYYAVLSDLTPPDAVTAFAAANIAGSDMFGTGIEAFRLGFAGFLVPFAFVYHPELLLRGDWSQVFLMSGFAAISAVALASCVVGQGWGPLGGWLRGLCLVAAGMMVVPRLGLQLGGLALYVAILLFSAWQRRTAPALSRG
ncbi:MAG TPA: TRAP transporter fused permease subunit [Methylomirabilota bacterium]|nr:TRAP transporter fused permease subunit [Methylomirabilota bacterium]